MWDAEPVSISADDAMRGGDIERKAPALNEAMTWLRGILAAGTLPANTVWQRAKEARIASRTLSRAKAELKIKTEKDGKGGWSWSLSEE
jgi:hypothetical protein